MLEKGARKPSALLHIPLVPETCSSSSPLLQTISHGANPDVPNEEHSEEQDTQVGTGGGGWAGPVFPPHTVQSPHALTSLLMVESLCIILWMWESRLAPEEHLARAAAWDSFSRCRTMASQPSHSAMVCS